MEVYLLTEVTYDYYAFPEVFGIFDSVESAREFVIKIKSKYNSCTLPIYDLTDKSVNWDNILKDLQKREVSHWEIEKYTLNVGELNDDYNWIKQD